MKKENTQLKTKLHSTQFWLVAVGAAIGGIVAGVIGIIVFAQRKPYPAELIPDQAKCPRCGWTIDPADDVCGNPDCRTRLR